MKILVAGDYCPRERLAKVIEKEDYTSMFGGVKSLIEEANYSIVNFECPVVKGNADPIKKQGSNLRCSSYGASALRWAGFNCVTLANNHFLDFGEKGVVDTLEACAENKIDTVGGGINLMEAAKTLYKSIAGKTLAIINCCEHEYSIATATTAGSNPLNPIEQYYAIKEARNNADHVIVIVHGGHEHFQLPSLRMKETYHFFIDAGADAVINHHQHCYSGYEVYNNKPIFYGIGNFCFDHPKKHNGSWTEGYMVTLDFNGYLSSFTIHPFRQCADKPNVELLSNNAFDDQLIALNKIIVQNDCLENAVESYYQKSKNEISAVLSPISNRYYCIAIGRGWLPPLIFKNKKTRIENITCCESHRDKLQYYLNKRLK